MNTHQIERKDTVPNSDAEFAKALQQERRLSWGQWIMLVTAGGLALAMTVGLAPGSRWDRVLGGSVLVFLACGIWEVRRCRADAPAMGALLLDLGPRAISGSVLLGVCVLVMTVLNVVSASSGKDRWIGAFLLLGAGFAFTARRMRRCLMGRGVWDQGIFSSWEMFEGYQWGGVERRASLKLWRKSKPGWFRHLGLRPTPVILSVRPAQKAAVEAVVSRFVPREGPLPPGLQPAGEQGAGANQRGPQEDPMPQNPPKL